MSRPLRLAVPGGVVLLELLAVTVGYSLLEFKACGPDYVCSPGEPTRLALFIAALVGTPAITVVGFWVRNIAVVILGSVLALAAAVALPVFL